MTSHYPTIGQSENVSLIWTHCAEVRKFFSTSTLSESYSYVSVTNFSFVGPCFISDLVPVVQKLAPPDKLLSSGLV